MRIAYYDNLKYLLILLVVFGHIIGKSRDVFYEEYFFIFSFHMPLFVMISGYFSKVLTTKKDYWQLTQVILVPYILLQLFYGITDVLIYGKGFAASFVHPNWGMWYLLSLFSWRLLLNVVDQYRYTLVVLVIIALMIGYDRSVGGTLSFSRTIVFFPFFYAGYLLAKHKIDLSVLSKYRLVGLSILAFFVILLYATDPSIDLKWFYGKYSYLKMDEPVFGVLYRSSQYVLAMIVGVGFLMVIPRKEFFFTKWGSKTMNVYVWHFLLLDALTRSGFYTRYADFFSTHSILTFLFFILLTLLIAYVLSSAFVEKYLSPHKIPIERFLKK